MTDTSNAPLEGVTLELYTGAGEWPVETDESDINGEFVLNGLRPDGFYLKAHPGDSYEQSYTRWYSNRVPVTGFSGPLSAGADLIPLALSETRSNITIALPAFDPPGSISGTLTDQATGLPIYESYFDAFAGVDIYCTNGTWIEGLETDTNGSYHSGPLAPGHYHVVGSHSVFGTQHVTTWYGGDHTMNALGVGGTPVSVPPGSDVSGINISLPAGQYAYLQYTYANGLPVFVSEWPVCNALITDDSGRTLAYTYAPGIGYTDGVDGVPSNGVVYARTRLAVATNACSAWYGDVPVITGNPVLDGATPLSTSSPLPNPIPIHHGDVGLLTGRRLVTQGPLPLQTLGIYTTTGAAFDLWVNLDGTNRFEVALPPGTYYVRTRQPYEMPEVVDQWYSGVPALSDDPIADGATPVVITAGVTTDIADVLLDPYVVQVDVSRSGGEIHMEWNQIVGQAYLVQQGMLDSGAWVRAPYGVDSNQQSVTRGASPDPGNYHIFDCTAPHAAFRVLPIDE